MAAKTVTFALKTPATNVPAEVTAYLNTQDATQKTSPADINQLRDAAIDHASLLDALLARVAALEAGGGTTPPVKVGYTETGIGDSQFDSGFEYLMSQKYPAHTIGRFTYPQQATDYILAQLSQPFPSAGGAQGKTLAQWLDPGKNNIVHIYAGTNDVALLNRTGQQVFDGVKALVQKVRTDGADKVVVYTVTSVRRANDSGLIAAREAARTEGNAKLRAKTGGVFDVGADAVVDIGATQELGQRDSALSTYYFLTTDAANPDLHWSDNGGKPIVYDMLGQAVTAVMAGQTGVLITTHSQPAEPGGEDPGGEDPGGEGPGNEGFVAFETTGPLSADVTITGGDSFTATSGSAGARDRRTATGDVHVQGMVSTGSKGVFIGFVTDFNANPTDQSSYLLCVQLDDSSMSFYVRQLGTFLAQGLPYANGDVLTVSRVGVDGVIRRNGNVVHTAENAFASYSGAIAACITIRVAGSTVADVAVQSANLSA